MKWVGAGLAGLGTDDVEVHYDRLLAAADHYGLNRFIGTRVHFLMGNVRRNVDEIAGSGFFDVFEALAPTEAGTAMNDVENRFELAVMVGGGAGGGFHSHGAGPQLAGARAGVGNGRGPSHPRRLGRVRVQLTRADDADPVLFPIRLFLNWRLLIVHGNVTIRAPKMTV